MTADVPATFNFLCRRVLSFRFITSIVAGNCLILFTTQNVYEERETGSRDQNQMWPKYYKKNLKPWGLDRTSVAHRLWWSNCMGENASWEIASCCGFSIAFYLPCTMVTIIEKIPTMHQTSPVTTFHSPIKAMFQYYSTMYTYISQEASVWRLPEYFI